jgi:D-serine deaminase-like pyridoxal phosphate-dependent protein
MIRAEIPTPALLLDLDAFDANVTTMTRCVAAHGKGLRPHAKTTSVRRLRAVSCAPARQAPARRNSAKRKSSPPTTCAACS